MTIQPTVEQNAEFFSAEHYENIVRIKLLFLTRL
jgi:hypothetical protein